MANSRIPSIPNLADETIFHCIHNVTNLTLTPNDLKNPTVSVTDNVCDFALCFLRN